MHRLAVRKPDGLGTNEDGSQPLPLYTFTIITTDSCKDLETLHDRMPVLLPDQEAVHAWIKGGHASVKGHSGPGHAAETGHASVPAGLASATAGHAGAEGHAGPEHAGHTTTAAAAAAAAGHAARHAAAGHAAAGHASVQAGHARATAGLSEEEVKHDKVMVGAHGSPEVAV